MPNSPQQEIWKDIVGYEGYYQVSSLARVRSLDRHVKGKGCVPNKFLKGEILSQSINTKRGRRARYKVMLNRDGKTKTFTVHRLVAFAFVSGWFDGAIVNHKDNNPVNNLPSNLEWCTYSENTRHALALGAWSERRGSRPFRVVDTVSGEIFPTISKASEARKIARSHLSRMLKGESKNSTTLILKAA